MFPGLIFVDQTVKNLLSGPDKNRLYYDVIVTTRQEMQAQNILSDGPPEVKKEIRGQGQMLTSSEDQDQAGASSESHVEAEVTEERSSEVKEKKQEKKKDGKKSKKLTPNEEAAQKRKL